MIETRVEDHTIHITGYVSSDAYGPLKEALSQVSDRIVLSFDEKCFINSTGLAVLMDLLLPIRTGPSPSCIPRRTSGGCSRSQGWQGALRWRVSDNRGMR